MRTVWFTRSLSEALEVMKDLRSGSIAARPASRHFPWEGRLFVVSSGKKETGTDLAE